MRRRLFILIFALAALLYFLYRVAHQYAFETYLDTLNITFDDFPPEYAKVLNDSVARGQQPEDFDYAATFTETQIPRLIHYIWFKDLYATREGATQIPSVGSRSPELCRQFNPGYEIRMWNATSAREFLAAEYAWFLPTYDGYRYPIQRIDALKYFVLWHFGGVYMDLDIACRRSLDPLLGFPAWFPEASPLGVNNDLMASRKGHSILREMTEGLITHNRNYLSPYLTIFWTTGPSFTSQMLQEWYEKCGRGGCSGRSGNKTAGE
ncbi:hypothetical protein EJ02DRAFT_409979 [Clathrospora elynae]|uniref:Glycosyl transferase n=1 Tax=Clathrospora elynae TaxID=706981 RepID=A0A6A5SFJ1_9PLEO|nr:hypothetical protein EJ02DRAFT_409979 [Clathrospora elynae]